MMRITSGEHRGRKVSMPAGIRPTQEKVRKAVFDILGDIAGLSFLELFAGSGAVGLEAVSRGVKELALVEYNSDCLAAIRKNIDSLKLKACSIYPKEAEDAVKIFLKEGRKFDIIFLDPPYYKGKVIRGGDSLTKKTLQTLSSCDILTPCGFIICQHFKKDDLPAQLGVLALLKRKVYGDTVVSFYVKKEA